MSRQIQICKCRPVTQKYRLNGDVFFEDTIFEDLLAGLVVSSSINQWQILKH